VPSYLLDSDVLIWILRNRESTVRMVEELAGRATEPLACSALSVMEIEVGVKPGEEARTAECLDGLTVLPVDGELAREAAALLRKRKRLEPREWVDALIAATAIRHGLTLVTYNRRDYPYSEVSLHPV
jgi:hypothetical protein